MYAMQSCRRHDMHKIISVDDDYVNAALVYRDI